MSATTSIATARRLLAKFGEPVVLSYVAGGSIDPATGEGTPGSTVTINGNGYPSRYRADQVDGTQVLGTDTRLILELVDERPAPGWAAQVNGITFRVMDAQPIRKTAQDVIYICQLRESA